MAERIFVKPAADVRVRLPDSKKHVPADGCAVELTSYIVRRLEEGSLIRVEQAPVAKKQASKEGDKQ